jgi:hypothetical protein
MTEVKDLLGAGLEAKGKELDERQRQLDADREKWRATVRQYAEFMREAGQTVPAFAMHLDKPDPMARPPNPDTNAYRIVKLAGPRLGAKRKIVLEYIAQATKENRKTTSREIAENTGLNILLVTNVMYEDYHNEYIDRINTIETGGPAKAYELMMTQKGFDFLEAAAKSGAPKKRDYRRTNPTDPARDP